MYGKIGYLSNYIPEEVIAVFGTPHRIIGDFSKIENQELPYFTCSFVREFVTSFNNGEFDFLSGIIIPTSCDSLFSSFDLLDRANIFKYCFSQPVKSGFRSEDYYKKQIIDMIEFLQNELSVDFSINKLKEKIRLSNLQKVKLVDIKNLISKENINCSYQEFLKIILYVMQHDFEKNLQYISNKYGKLENYDEFVDVIRRVMIIGPIVDNFDIIEIIETFDRTKIITDNITNSKRYFYGEINENIHPLKAIAKYYCNKLQSPTFLNEISYIKETEKEIIENDINIVILLNQRGCEPHTFYSTIIEAICDKLQITFLSLNIEHSEEKLDKIKLKIESTLEMVS